jgi:hypothetical protein
MVYTELNSARSGEQAGIIKDYSVGTISTDSSTGIDETEYLNTKAEQYLGYYKKIPELKMAIDAKATWTIGKGIESSPLTGLVLGTMSGFGKDTFNSVLENAIRCYHIYGDSFAEIIRDDEDRLINLKILDPASIKIVADSKGRIKRYEQIAKGKPTKKFEPKDILHLARNRIADEIHGVSIIDAVEWIILARNEAMTDYKRLLHRNIYPVRIWHLDTDDVTKIATFKAKVAASKGEGEDIFIPKGAVETDLVSIPENSSLNPMPWIQLLNQYFYQAVGVPQIIIGGSQELTQTAAQIAYLAFEQTIEEEQLYIEEQILAQLNLEIELEFPASLQNNLLSDQAKDGTLEQNTNQPEKLVPSMAKQENQTPRGE